MWGAGKVVVLVLLALLVCAAPAPAQTASDGDVYARVGPNEVVLGNSVAERRWSRDALRTTLLSDKRAGARRWSARHRDFSLSLGGVEVGSETFAVRSVDIAHLPRGGLRVTMRLAAAAGGLAATRVAEAYPGIAGFRTQTTLLPAAPVTLSAATLDEAAVGAVAPTIHAFRAGADWRQPGYTGPDVSVGDPHGGTWRASQSARTGSGLGGAAQWLTAASGGRELFMVMERNDFPSSQADYDGSVARLRVEYARDVIILGPLEEQAHVENPFASGDGGRQRTLQAGVPFPLEAAFTGFADHEGDEGWQFYRYLTEHRLAPYPKAVTFNSNGTDSNKISTGAKDDMDLATVREVATLARRLGVETFILDDGWQARSGDWQPDSPAFPEPRYDGSPASRFKPRFPDPRFEAVRREIAPMRLGLWMSPLHFHPSSRAGAERRAAICQPVGGGLLLSNTAEPYSSSNEAGIVTWGPEIVPYVESRIRDGIENWGVVYWKFDFMAWLDCAGQGDVYALHDAFLGMIDRLQRDHPGVTFQIDETNDYRLFPFESVSRSPSWFQNGSPAPEILLHNLWNLSPYIPGFSLGQHALGGEHYKRHPVDTLMAAAMPSHITFFTDIRKLPPAVIDQARPWLDFYKRHRGLLAQMTYPLLEDPLEQRWTALQAWNPDAGRGALLAFRQDAAEPTKQIALRNVPAGRRFDLFEGPTGRYAGTVTSARLSRGLTVHLAAKRQARVLLIVPARRPRVSVRVACKGSRPRARVGGRDARSIGRVEFVVGGRVVARDRRAPFARAFSARHRRRILRTQARMRNGRVVTIRRRLPRCARRSVAPAPQADPRFAG